MDIYHLPKINLNFKKTISIIFNALKKRTFWIIFLSFLTGCSLALSVIISIPKYFPSQTNAFFDYFKKVEQKKVDENTQPILNEYVSKDAYEQAIMNVAKNVSPSVVSIVVSKNVPVYEQQLINPFGDLGQGFEIQIPQMVQKGTKFQQVGAGSGFIVSQDGLVLTNKHVVLDDLAEYTVYTNDGSKFKAKVLAKDPVQDLAVIKIQSTDNNFRPITLGDSAGIQIGQTAIAIGNALGQFSNTVSVGVVSGMGRTISASDNAGSFSETLENILQTDAAINEGNSGGPLLNLRGEVIGVNVAMADGAQAIGFALPINLAKKSIDQVIKTSKIVYPFLGVRYVLINQDVKDEYELSIDYGALVLKGKKGEPAVTEGAPADKAGIKNKDIILQINGEKIANNNSLAQLIQKYNVGDKVVLHILREGKEMDLEAILTERE